MGKDGFAWWIGVVEDRMDPKMLGRCRVRVLGYHTPDKEDIPTENLPWAHPITPITSAAMNGIGFSPVGPVEGTWIFGFFRDGVNAQQPIMLGTIGGIPEKGPAEEGEEKFAGTEKRPKDWYDKELGFTDPRKGGESEEGEEGEEGGKSQKLKDVPTEGQGKENGKGFFEKQEYIDGAEADGDDSGPQLENEEEGKNFPRKDYIGSDEEEGEPDTNRLARNIEEEIKKTVVEFKRNLLTVPAEEEDGGGGGDDDDEEGNGKFKEQGLRDTKIFVADCDIPEFYCGITNESFVARGTEKFPDANNLKITSSSFTSLNKDWKLFSDEGTDSKDEKLNAEPNGGGGGANTNGWWNEPETSYARYGIGDKKGEDVEERDVNDADPPLTIYPYNKVYQSESGHIFEIDDTPNAERLHQYHRSGTFEEIHPNGDRVTKVVRDNYTTILRNDMIHIDGFASTTVDKGLKIFVNRDRLENEKEKSVNFDIHVGENANVNIFVEKGHVNTRVIEGDVNINLEKGDMNIRQNNGDYNHFINGDYNLEVMGHHHTVVKENHLTEIGGSRDCRVDGEFDYLSLTGYGIEQPEGAGEQVTDNETGETSTPVPFERPYQELLNTGDIKQVIWGKVEQDIYKNHQVVVWEDYELETKKNYNCITGWNWKTHCKFNIDLQADWNLKMRSEFQASLHASQLILMGDVDAHMTGGLVTRITSGAYIELLATVEIRQTGHEFINLNGPVAMAAETPQVTQTAPHPPHEPKDPSTWRKTPNENEEPQEKGSEQNVGHSHTEEIDIDKYNQEDSGDKEVIKKLKEIPEG